MDKLTKARENLGRLLEARGMSVYKLAQDARSELGRPYIRTYFDDFLRGRKGSLKYSAMQAAALVLDCDVRYLTGDDDLPLDIAQVRSYDPKVDEKNAASAAAVPFPTSANAQMTGPVSLDSAHTIPVYGQAIGGDDGQFVLNGNHLQDVLAPPSLRGVKGAYGARVAGDSMVPRYYADEVVYMNPNRAVRRGDFVTAQIYGDDEDTVSAYVKEFVTLNQKELVLKQFNPPKELRFPASKVKSVHRIVMGGEG